MIQTGPNIIQPKENFSYKQFPIDFLKSNALPAPLELLLKALLGNQARALTCDLFHIM